MKPAFAVFLAALPFATWSPPTPAQDPAKTIGEVLLSMQEDSARPIVEYCVSAVPELGTSLQAAFTDFQSKSRAAAATSLAAHFSSEELARPPDAQLLAEFQQVRDLMLADVRTRDADEFCRRLETRLTQVTAEALREQTEAAVSEYERKAREKAAGAQ